MSRKLPPRRTTAVSGSHTNPDRVELPTLEAKETVVDLPEGTIAIGPGLVSIRLGTKLSDSVYWGSGVWDKIPYSIEAACQVDLPCGTSLEQIGAAKALAIQLALQGVRDGLLVALPAHVDEIQRLYPAYFK